MYVQVGRPVRSSSAWPRSRPCRWRTADCWQRWRVGLGQLYVLRQQPRWNDIAHRLDRRLRYFL